MQCRLASQATLFLLFSYLLIGILEIQSIHARPIEDEFSHKVPSDILQNAVQYVLQHKYGGSNERTLQVLKRLESGDVDTLYEVARSMNEMKNKDNMLASIRIWHALADDNNHILSQIALGFAYSENDKATAVTYFVQAGEAGPHQAALYNAGRLLCDPEIEDFVKALAYLRAAYSLEETHPKYSTNHLTETSKVAYDRLSEQLVALINKSLTTKGSILSIQQAADMFLYANLKNFPSEKSKEERRWAKAMQSLQSKEWDIAYIEFGKLEKNFEEQLSNLQIAILHVLSQYCKSMSGISLNDEL